MNKTIWYWRTLLWSVFMLAVFLLPADNLSKAPSIPFLDKAVHMFMFAVFTWFLVRDQTRTQGLKRPVLRIFLIAVVASLLFGSVIELLQQASQLGRSAELKDVIYDVAGCLVSTVIILILYRSFRSFLPKY